MNFFGLTGLAPSSPKVVYDDDKIVRDDSELNRICQLVYVPDERTGLPSSDLSILFSDSVPADISAWVRANLQMPHSIEGVSSNISGNQVDDDTLLELTRNKGESNSEYITRVNNYLVTNFKGSN